MTHIALIDDDETTLLTTQLLLEQSGHTVTQFSKSSDAVAVLATLEVDLVLLDILMPAPNGYEVLEKLRTYPHYATTPIVFMTAKDLPAEYLDGYHKGADYYLSKPFSKDQLLAVVSLFASQK